MTIEVDLEAERTRRLLVLLQQSARYILGPPLREAIVEMVNLLKEYPPELPDQKYRRTGNLGQRWTFEVTTSLYGVQAIAGNNTPYGPKVQSEADQAPIHQGRWRTEVQTLREKQDDVVRRTNEALQRFLEANA